MVQVQMDNQKSLISINNNIEPNEYVSQEVTQVSLDNQISDFSQHFSGSDVNAITL